MHRLLARSRTLDVIIRFIVSMTLFTSIFSLCYPDMIPTLCYEAKLIWQFVSVAYVTIWSGVRAVLPI